MDDTCSCTFGLRQEGSERKDILCAAARAEQVAEERCAMMHCVPGG